MHISSFWLNVYNDANATYTHAYRMQKYIIESNGAAIGKHGDDRSDQSQYVLYSHQHENILKSAETCYICWSIFVLLLILNWYWTVAQG